MNISTSIRRLTYLFIILFVGLSAGLVYWQIVVAQQVASNTFSTFSRECRADNAPIRGRIYDRNGVLLAYSIPNTKDPMLCGWQRVYTPAAQSLEGVIGYYISPLFGSIGIENQFNDYLNGQVGSTGLNNTIRKVLHSPPVGDDIYLTIDSNIQKIVNQSYNITVPVDGITVFQPKGGSIIVSNPSTGEILAMLSRPGYDANCVVYCTLAQLKTDFAAKGYNTNVIDQNCQNTNSCNLIYFNQLERDPAQPLLERPIDSCYIPGSTYKTMTLMAGLDSGTSHLNDKYYNFNGFNPPQYSQAIGPVKIGDGFDKETFGPVGNNISGYTYTYPVNLLYGYTHSDNIIFAQAGAKAGVNTWLSYNRALYVEKQIPFDLPVHVSTVTPQKNLCPLTPPSQATTSLKQVAENAFGQGVDFVTPMQMELINNTVANNGHLMRPTLIYKIVDQNQVPLQSFNPVELGAPISDTTAAEVRDAMYGVVQCGSGSLTQVQLTGSKWSIIGKTGTGQVDSTGKTPAESWFITQAPYVFQSNQVPRLTIVAMKENAGEGAFANGPMLRTIYDRIFTEVKGYNDVPPSQPPNPNFCFSTGLLQAHP